MVFSQYKSNLVFIYMVESIKNPLKRMILAYPLPLCLHPRRKDQGI
jgi:hypothetical protein